MDAVERLKLSMDNLNLQLRILGGGDPQVVEEKIRNWLNRRIQQFPFRELSQSTRQPPPSTVAVFFYRKARAALNDLLELGGPFCTALPNLRLLDDMRDILAGIIDKENKAERNSLLS